MARRLTRVLQGPLAPALKPVTRTLELWCRWSNRPAGVVLLYHIVGDPQGDHDRELLAALGTKTFESHVRHLKRRYRLVPASDVLAAASARRRGQRFPVAITFDDDLPNHVRYAMPILERNGAPATFFLSGASLERPFGFWWERLQRAWDRGTVEQRLWEQLGPIGTEVPRPGIKRVSQAIQALPPDRRRRLTDELGAMASPDPHDSGIRAGEVMHLVNAGFDIGFHTLHHEVLPALDDEALADAMTEGREPLEEATQGARGVTSMISYPYGKADRRVAEAARSAGYSHGFTAYERAIDARSDPLLIDRINPEHLLTPGAFAFKLARALLEQRAA
jgi:peptidoglycan/xylan/chitin deacetylase (PgdA/CDA1 family)